MADYISRDDAINFFENMTWYHVNRRGQLVDGANSDTGLYKAKDVYKGLHDIPAADVVPVVHAYWRDTGSGQECSACKEIQYGYDTGRYFCANCGAKIDGERKENRNEAD